MLLGMDILWEHKAKMDLELGIINLCGEEMQMTYGRGETESVARMTLLREVCIPAGSAVLCAFKLDRSLSEFITIPGIEELSEALLMPHTYHAAGELSVACLVNASEEDITLKKGSFLGEAVETDLHVPAPYSRRAARRLAE